MTTAIESALFYAQEKVWPVFPLAPRDKRPLFPAAHEPGNPCRGECGKLGHGLHDAVTDPAILREWWQKAPAAGVGIATGKKSGIFVLDVDPLHGGDVTLAALLEKHGALPETVMQQTGGGGRHILFQYPPVELRNTTGKIGPGLDTRAEGGYICGAPTVHPSGNLYRWIIAPSKHAIAQAPDWLLHALIDNKPAQGPAQVVDGQAFPTGQRNSSLTAMAGSMQRRGFTAESMFLALNAENLNRCVPPLAESEIRAIVNSVLRYAPTAAPDMQPRDRIASEWAFCKIIFEYPSEHVDFLDIAPDMFGEPKLRLFYTNFLAGMSTAQAALQAGVLAELEGYQAYYVPRVDEYAAAIRNFSRYEAVAWLGGRLAKAAQNGDETKITGLVLEITKAAEPKDAQRAQTTADIAEEVENDIIERSQDPRDVWGIAYPFPTLSAHTGGKHLGELIIIAGEPGVGKSWLMAQDALYTGITLGVPVYYWSGEMGKKQTMRRMYALMGVNKRNMDTGRMTEQDWDLLSDAKKRIAEAPIYIEDGPLHIHQCRAVLKRARALWDVQEFIFDYASLIDAPGKDDTEKSAVVSRELKIICQSKGTNFAGMLLSSVTKAGMDKENAEKAAMKGSGQQIHDADVIYFLTTFAQIENDKVAFRFKPNEFDRLATLHIKKGRELEKTLVGQRLHLSRMHGPNFQEELQEQRRLP